MTTDNTPTIIIQDAMTEAGLLAEGTLPNSDQYAKYLRKLRDLIRFEQTQGLKLFLNTDTTVTLTGGTGTYTFGPTGTVTMTKPLRVVDAYWQDTSGNRRPLIPLARADYDLLSQVSQQGDITQYFVDKQSVNLSVTFWQIPTTNVASLGSPHLVFQVAATAPVTLTETTCFPDEWRTFLVWALADEISSGQPESIMTKCATKASQYRGALEDWDVEDVQTRFTPDSRYLGSSSFR